MLSILWKKVTLAIIFILAFGMLFICLSPIGNQHIVLGCGGDILAMCKMSPLNHIAHFQHLFASIIPQVISILGLLFTGIFVHIKYRDRTRSNQSLIFKYLKFRKRVYFLESLQNAFSRGILHPKLF